MIQAKSMLYVYVETSLHAGSGRGLGAIDLPIQREQTTGYPMVQASGVKGRLRAETDSNIENNPNPPEPKLSRDEWLTIFGPDAGENASEFAGAFSVGDLRLLLFPVRSLSGVFAWTTSVDVLQRFQRDALASGVEFKKDEFDEFPIPNEPANDKVYIGDPSELPVGNSVVLEEFSFEKDDAQKASVNAIAKWIVENVLPNETEFPEYKYWREQLPKKLCILPQNAFRDFATYATEVQTHIKIEPETKTVKGGALWTVESLPTDTVMYAPLMATPPRRKDSGFADGKAILEKVTTLKLNRMHLGGDETTGQGMVALRFGGVK